MIHLVDLHCHTEKSDNSFDLVNLLKIAKEKGINYLGVTDHDTTSAIRQAETIALKFGITIVPGIEISAFDYVRKKKVHILGYYFDLDSGTIEEFCKSILNIRNIESKNIVEYLIKQGYDISWKEIKEFAKLSKCVYKKHIMHELIKKGYCQSIYCNLYKKIINYSKEIFSNKKNDLIYVDVRDAIKIIKTAGGVPVLAHAGVFDNFEGINEWIKFGLEGIEVDHPSHSYSDKKKCEYYAKKYNLIKTGGSDFHGFYGSQPQAFGKIDAGIDSINKLKSKSEKVHNKWVAV